MKNTQASVVRSPRTCLVSQVVVLDICLLPLASVYRHVLQQVQK